MPKISTLNPEVMNSIRQDTDLMLEIANLANSDAGLWYGGGQGVDHESFQSSLESFRETGGFAEASDMDDVSEAIILRIGRPSFLIRDDEYQIPSNQRVWDSRLLPRKTDIEAAIKGVGRIELERHPSYSWVGTAWLIESDKIITNRHVANLFAQGGRGGFVFRPGLGGVAVAASIDFKEEYGSTNSNPIAIERVLYIAPDQVGQPDMAVLKLVNGSHGNPIPLATTSRPEGEYIAAIGYPARDDYRNLPSVAVTIFNDIYEKKRIAPGKVKQSGNSDPNTFEHDCSTLGGNSGSAIIDVSTGRALGLHFAGRFEQSNYAVRVETIKRVLSGLSRSTISRGQANEATESPDTYAERPGYQPDFLGDSAKYIPLPIVRRNPSDQLRQTAGSQRGSAELKYMHFSIVMSRSRKLPYFTAVNIDGRSLQRPPRRRDVWRFDPRIPQSAQIGNSLYQGNNLDRGHQVRRLDPVWGTTEEALTAQEDTFHYTNSCPQHARLNQGKTQWVGLEDYILDNTDRRNLQISVFTGPVLNDEGVPYRDSLIPNEYWKIVANIREDGRLSVTGYVLSQGQFLGDIEFAFGAYRTFQLPVHKIEEMTGLYFGSLSDFDPIGHTEGISGAIEIETLDRIVL